MNKSLPSSIFHLPSIRAKALMIQGTGSGAGKSLMVSALCRIFRDMGINTAPFKAQNMALNSYITKDGGEIGRAQALQAEAAKIEPTVDMNPILLKASGEAGSQVIIHGRVHSNMKAREYYAFKKEAWKAVKHSYKRLSSNYELIVIEGAGSPAEINLMDVDIVNMSVARMAKAPVILVGDIDKGGVFASLYGTVELLGKDSKHIKGFIINKFRGDLGILKPGLEMISKKTGIPVIGVLPYINNVGLSEEDGLSLSNGRWKMEDGKRKEIKIVIVRLPFISNFTDFDPFLYEPDVELTYSQNPSEIENADIVIVPGSKNSVKDLLFLKEYGLSESIKRAFLKGIQIIGICGGYQILGKKIFDPYGIESSHKEIDGIGLLNIETSFGKEKITCQVEAEMTGSKGFLFPTPNSELRTPNLLYGYEIHMGTSMGDIGLFKVKRISSCLALPTPILTGETHVLLGKRGISLPLKTPNLKLILDGSINKNCWGTYIHGIFEDDTFKRAVINKARIKKGLPSCDSSFCYAKIKEERIDNLANIVRKNLDMNFVKKLTGL